MGDVHTIAPTQGRIDDGGKSLGVLLDVVTLLHAAMREAEECDDGESLVGSVDELGNASTRAVSLLVMADHKVREVIGSITAR